MANLLIRRANSTAALVGYAVVLGLGAHIGWICWLRRCNLIERERLRNIGAQKS